MPRNGVRKYPDLSKMSPTPGMMKARMERRAELKALSEGRDLYGTAPKDVGSEAAAGAAAGAVSRQRGGPVKKGKRYKVGEKGPEKFVPKKSTRKTTATKKSPTRRTKR